MTYQIAKDKSRAARAVQRLYRSIREDIEDSGGGWNGGDVVELMCEWFKTHGFDVDGPNPWAEEEDDDYEHAEWCCVEDDGTGCCC